MGENGITAINNLLGDDEEMGAASNNALAINN